MDQLTFERANKTYIVKPNGVASVQDGATTRAAKWTAESSEEKNRLKITSGNEVLIEVDAKYTFESGSNVDIGGEKIRIRNLLQVSIAAEGGGDPSTAFFGGTILIDDRKDVEYALDAGGSFIVYGKLSFSDEYDQLILTDEETGATAEIDGAVAVDTNDGGKDDELDVLRFTASTRWKDKDGEPKKNRAKIQLSGAFEPQDGKIVFHGKIEDQETFTIVLAGRYRLVAGALEIHSKDGELGLLLRLEGQLKFFGTSGKWRLSLGHSKGEFEMEAGIRFDKPITSKDGRIKITGGASVSLDGEQFKAELDLDVTAKVKSGGILKFELAAGLINGEPEFALRGKYLGKDDTQLTFEVGYADSKAQLKFGYESSKLKAAIKLVTDGETISGSWSVTLTFDSSGKMPVKGGIERGGSGESGSMALLGGAVDPALGASGGVTVLERVITPKTFPNYPSTGPYRSNDFDLLHPVIRKKVIALQTKIHREGIPLYVFEAYRSPERQNKLFARKPKVTNAEAWESYHQYGVAVDFVFYENGWHWGKKKQHDKWYETLHRYARDMGLERLSWETPHLQLAGVELADLRKGRYPAGGDLTWGENLVSVINDWKKVKGKPAAPPLPVDFKDFDRPPLDDLANHDIGVGTIRRLMVPADLDGANKFHSRNGGKEWKVDITGEVRGVFIRGKGKPERTTGQPVTMRKIRSLYQDLISECAIEFDVPEELIFMTIATETSIYRNVGFTGPRTFRWEPHIADYSAGPMQTLAGTVRYLIDKYPTLGLDPDLVAPAYSSEPVPPPNGHPLYDPRMNIRLGTLEIKDRLSLTGYDPVLVAAAYNSGGLRPTLKNDWHLHTHGNHLDRAAEWFGDFFAIDTE